jgi:sugar lactone lactonase YvrE
MEEPMKLQKLLARSSPQGKHRAFFTPHFSAVLLSLLIAFSRVALADPSEIRIPGDRAFPESITSTADGTIYIGSMALGQVYRVPPGADTAEPWIKQGTNGLISVVGVLADDRSGTLWVCSSNMTGMGVSFSGSPAETSLKAFDLKTGTPKGSYPFPEGKGFCNDVAIGRDGAAYVTDTIIPRILRLKQGAAQLETWVENPVFGTTGANLDGIAFGGDNNLYVNTFEGFKLFRVNVDADNSAGAITELRTSQPLDHPDAIRPLGGQTFLMIEGAGRLDRVEISGDAAKLTVLKDGMNGPVSVTQIGNTAWALEGQLELLFDPSKSNTKPDPFRAIAVPLK